MVTLTEYDKCHRFDEIMAKFGGSKKNSSVVQRNIQLAVQMYEQIEDRVEGRRMSTGRIKTSSHPLERGLIQVPSSSSKSGGNQTSPSSSSSKSRAESTDGILNRASKKPIKTRRASSFDPKLAASMSLDIETDDDEEELDEYASSSNHTPFSSPSDTSTNQTAKDSSADTVDKEIVFSSTEILALRLMFSMYDRYTKFSQVSMHLCTNNNFDSDIMVSIKPVYKFALLAFYVVGFEPSH